MGERTHSETELAVLECLFDTTHAYGEFCTNFKLIARNTKLPIHDIRMACRSLAKQGLAEFWRGLMTEDGEVAGSGYCITAAGREVMEPIIGARESALAKASPHV